MTKGMSDLISRSELKKAIDFNKICFDCPIVNGNVCDDCKIALIKGHIDNAPTVELKMGRMTNGFIIPIKGGRQ